MIKLVTDKRQLEFAGGTPFGCKIMSAANAYGLTFKTVEFWVQDGQRAATAKIDGDVLVADNGLDPGEMARFIKMLSPKSVSCAKQAALKLGVPVSRCGRIMFSRSIRNADIKYAPEVNPPIREIYALLCSCGSSTFTPPPFEPFYLDMSHRTRHGAALSVGVRHEGRLAACAVCTAACGESAVISAVACLPQERGHGFASFAVRAIAAMLGRNTAYIFRADGENEKFYRSLGFEDYGDWSETDFGSTVKKKE